MKNIIHSMLINRMTPIQKKRWVFTSFSGHYSDSPKSLSEKLHEIDDSVEIIWLVDEKYVSDVPEYAKIAVYGTKEAEKYKASAEIIIDNVYGSRALTVFGNGLIKRLKTFVFYMGFIKNGQKIYTTWHGTPLKRMGRDQIGNDVSDFVCCNLNMILGNQFTMDRMKHLTFDKIPMKVLGTPRNDILFRNQNSSLRKKLGLPEDKKMILFAPTFRNDGKDVAGKNISRSGINQLNEIDFNKLFETLQKKFGGSWIMVCRFHYHVEQQVDWKMLDKQYNGTIINGNLHDDMAEYLACADILLTDASSCMFDYILTEKPCFLFFPDIDHYSKEERGFYLPINELPFSVAVTFDDLIQNIISFQEKEYIIAVQNLCDRLGYFEDGNASERILEWILKNADNQ